MALSRFGKYFEANNQAYDEYWGRVNEADAQRLENEKQAKEAASAASDAMNDLGEDAGWIQGALAAEGMGGVKPSDFADISPADTGIPLLNSGIDRTRGNFNRLMAETSNAVFGVDDEFSRHYAKNADIMESYHPETMPADLINRAQNGTLTEYLLSENGAIAPASNILASQLFFAPVSMAMAAAAETAPVLAALGLLGKGVSKVATPLAKGLLGNGPASKFLAGRAAQSVYGNEAAAQIARNAVANQASRAAVADVIGQAAAQKAMKAGYWGLLNAAGAPVEAITEVGGSMAENEASIDDDITQEAYEALQKDWADKYKTQFWQNTGFLTGSNFLQGALFGAMGKAGKKLPKVANPQTIAQRAANLGLNAAEFAALQGTELGSQVLEEMEQKAFSNRAEGKPYGYIPGYDMTPDQYEEGESAFVGMGLTGAAGGAARYVGSRIGRNKGSESTDLPNVDNNNPADQQNGEAEPPRNYNISDETSNPNVAAGTQSKLNQLADWYKATYGREFTMTSGKREGDGSSWHDSGNAFDIVDDLMESDAAVRQAVLAKAQELGLAGLDEYENPSAQATGGHLHFSDHGSEGMSADNGGYVGNEAADYADYIAGMDNLDALGDIITQDANGEITFLDNEENRAKLDAIAKQEEEAILGDNEQALQLANEAVTNRRNAQDMDAVTSAMETINSGDKDGIRELAREALRAQRKAKSAAAQQPGIVVNTQHVEQARKQQGGVQAKIGRQTPMPYHQFGGLRTQPGQIGRQTPVGAVGLQNNGNYNGSEQTNLDTAGQYGGLNYLNSNIDDNGRAVQGNQNILPGENQQQSIQPQQAAGQINAETVRTAGMKYAAQLIQQGNMEGARNVIEAIRAGNTTRINALLPQPIAPTRTAASSRQTNNINNPVKPELPRQLNAGKGRQADFNLPQSEQVEQRNVQDTQVNAKNDKDVSAEIQRKLDLVDTPEIWAGFSKVLSPQARPLFNYIKAWFSSLGSGAATMYDSLAHKRAKMIADRVEELRRTMKQGVNQGGLFRDEHGQEYYAPSVSMNYQWYKEALQRFGRNGRLMAGDLDEVLNLIAEEHLRDGYHDPYLTDIDVIEEQQRDFSRLEVTMTNFERMADYAERFAKGQEKQAADNRGRGEDGNRPSVERKAEPEQIRGEQESQSKETGKEVKADENIETEAEEGISTEADNGPVAAPESRKADAEQGEAAESETVEGEVSAEKENPTGEGEVELADGYKTESGRSLAEADETEFILKPDGSDTFGEISDDIEKATNGAVKKAPIKLRVGTAQYGYLHIIKHLPEMQKKGFDNALDYIKHVLNNFNQIYKEKDYPKRILLYCKGDASKGYMPIDLELSEGDDGYYTIVSAYPRRKVKGTPIYDGGAHPSTATTNGMLTAAADNNGGVEATARANAKEGVPTKDTVSQSEQESKQETEQDEAKPQGEVVGKEVTQTVAETKKAEKAKSEKAKQDKIEDFGQKIGGARKDIVRAHIAQLEANNDMDSMLKLSFNRIWPEPKYKAMLESGMPSTAVSFLRGLREGYKVPKSSVNKAWAKQAIEAKETARKILQLWEESQDKAKVTEAVENAARDLFSGAISENATPSEVFAAGRKMDAMANYYIYEKLGHDVTIGAKEAVKYGIYRMRSSYRWEPRPMFVAEIDGKQIADADLKKFVDKYVEAFNGKQQTKKVQKEKSDKPAWMDGINLKESDGQTVVQIDRKAIRKYGYRLEALDNKTFSTETEAMNNVKAAIFDTAFSVRKESDDEGNEYYRLYALHRTKDRVTALQLRDFATEAEAAKFVVNNFDAIMEANLTFNEGMLEVKGKQWEEMRSDTAQDYRKGKDVTPDDYAKTFGFRGVQFGEWNSQKERQALLNASYDALMDLAHLLGVDPHILSLNGELGIAFGARGTAGARAHFEANYTVINLTKRTGAGSLAHEWLHALDNYLLIKGGAIQTDRTSDGSLKKALSNLGHFMASAYSEAGLKNLAIPQGIAQAFSDLIKTATLKHRVKSVDMEDKRNALAKREKHVDGKLNELRKYLATPREYSRKKAAATDKQLLKFDNLAKLAFNQTVEYRVDETAATKTSYPFHYTNDALDKIAALCKEVTGSAHKDRVEEIAYALRGVERARKEVQELEAKGGQAEYEGNTDYFLEARKLEGTRGKPYWTSKWEMLARAFSSYLEDKMSEMGFESGFLNHGANNEALWDENPLAGMFNLKPYPEGAERKAINEAYDKFFEAIRNEIAKVKDETGEIKFSIRAAADRMEQGEINLEKLQAEFRGCKVEQLNDNNYVVTLPNGEKAYIDVENEIVMTANEAKRAKQEHGFETDANVVAEGKYTNINGRSIITLARNSGNKTVRHEKYHLAEDFMTKAQRERLAKLLPNAERRADAYADYEGGKKFSSWIAECFHNVKVLLDGLRGAFGNTAARERYNKAQAEKVFDEIDSGEIFKQGRSNATPEAFFVTNGAISGNTRLNVVDVTNSPLADLSDNKKKKDVGSVLVGKKFNIKSENGYATVTSKTKGAHFAASSYQTARHDITRAKMLTDKLDEILNNSVYVEKHKNKKNPQDGRRFIEIYTAVQDGDDVLRYRIVAEEVDKTAGEYEVKEAGLYDMMKDGTLYSTTPQEKGGQANKKAPSLQISVAELLQGVNDVNGKPYVDAKGNLVYEQGVKVNPKYSIKQDADGKLLAPNGKPSNLTPEQYKQVRTPEFKKWFGDWERAYSDVMPTVFEENLSLLDENGVEIDIKNTKAVSKWVRQNFQGSTVTIDSDNNVVGFSRKGIDDGVSKARDRGKTDKNNRLLYSKIQEIIKNSHFVNDEDVDERHKGRSLGIKNYVSLMFVGKQGYRVELSLNKQIDKSLVYKGHQAYKIEIRPYQHLDQAEQAAGLTDNSRISKYILSDILPEVNNNVSKVVDENGEPLVVYHGTNSMFNEFSKGDTGFHFGDKSAAEKRISDTDESSKRLIEAFLNIRHPFSISTDLGDWNGAEIADFILHDDPDLFDEDLVITQHDEEILQKVIDAKSTGYDGEGNVLFREWLKEKGYDGIRYVNDFESDGGYSYIALYPNQIKSATDNNGQFSADNDDIRYSVSEDTAEREHRPINLETVKEACKSAEVKEVKPGVFRATFKSGAKLYIHAQDNVVLTEDEEMQARRDHKIPDGVPIFVNGKQQGNTIDLSNYAEKGTINHELEHFAEKFMTKEQLNALIKHFGDAEARADAYLKFKEGRARYQGIIGKAMQVIDDTYTSVVALFGNERAKAEKVFGEIESGKIFSQQENSVDIRGENGNNENKLYRDSSDRLLLEYLKDDRGPDGKMINREEEIFNGVWNDYKNNNRVGKNQELKAIGDIIWARTVASFTNADDVDMLDVELNFARRCEEYVRRKIEPAQSVHEGTELTEEERTRKTALADSNGRTVRGSNSASLYGLNVRNEILSIADLDFSNQRKSEENYKRLLKEAQDGMLNSSFGLVSTMGDNGTTYRVDLERDLGATFKSDATVNYLLKYLKDKAAEFREKDSDTDGDTAEDRKHFTFKNIKTAKAFIKEADAHIKAEAASKAIEPENMRNGKYTTKKFSVGSNHSGSNYQGGFSITETIKNFFTGKGKDTALNRKVLREQMEDLTGLKIRWGKLGGKEAADLKEAAGIIRAKTAYDFKAVIPKAGKAICSALGIQSTEEMNNYIADWMLTGAVNNTSPEAAEFAKAMKAKPEFAEKLLDLQQNFDRYNNMSAMEKARNIISFQNVKETKLSDIVNKMHDQWVEELGPVKRMTEALEKRMGKKFSALTNPYTAFRLYRGNAGRAMALIEGRGDKIVEALKNTFPNVDFTDFKTLHQILADVGAIGNETTRNDFITYCMACHVKDMHEENKNLSPEEQYETPLTEAECDEIINDQDNIDRFGKSQKDLVRFSNVMLQMVHQAGLISTQRYFEMKKQWKNYVPMFRVFDEDENISFGNSLEHLTGSQRDVINPLESIIRNTFDMVAKAEKNAAKLKLVNIARCGGVGDIIEEVDSPGKVGETITFKEGGKTKYLQTDKAIVNAINNMGKDSTNQFIQFLRMPAAIARSAFTVNNLAFAVRNVFRDVADAVLYAKYGFNPVKDLAAGFMHAWNKDEIFYEWLSSGAAQSGRLTLDRNYTQTTLDDMTKTWKQRAGVQGILDLIQYASEISEAGTRIAVYTGAKRAVMEQGAKKAQAIAEAALQSRDLMDFARGGKASRSANQLIIFTNASIQGWDKFFREFNPKDPKQFAKSVAKLFFTAVLPAMLLSLWHGSEDWYKELPEWQKQNHWVFKLGDTIVRVPKGADIGVRFASNLVENMMAKQMYRKDIKAKNIVKPLLDNMPDWQLTALSPIMEAMANYSFFTERPIVPRREEKLPAKMQYASTTSALAKYLGEKLDISPRKIDHVLYGYTGNIGQGAIKAPELAYNTATGKARLFDFTAEQAPIVSGLLAVPYRSSQTVEDYYAEWDKQEKAANEFKATNKKPKDFNPARYERMKKLQKPLSELAKEERAVIDSRTLSAERKKDKQMAIQKRRIAMMKQALGRR